MFTLEAEMFLILSLFFFVDFLLIILEEFGAFWRRTVAGDRGYRYNRRKGIGKR